MKSVRVARRLLLIVAIVLLVIAAGAIAWLLSPSGRSAAALHNEYAQLRSQYEEQLHDVGPARDIDKRLAQAREQQAAFYTDRVPVGYSAISETLFDLAAKNHVQASALKYDAKDTDIPGLQRVGLAAQITGDYGDEMKFINAVERSKLFFVIDSVDLGAAEGGKVRLDIHFETYLRSA
jgi:Tfp pilus assembly protein PilO